MWNMWKEETKRSKGPKKQKLHNPEPKKYRSFKKLSWATMGYHYDWTDRSYNKDLKSEMPSLVGDLAQMFALTSLSITDNTCSDIWFDPSASIVNYYGVKSNMGGHRDDLELALDKPIVSFSVGLPAIFLLGGKTKDETPVIPILIRPGDVMCMGGDSRMNYHGMARLLPASVPLADIDPAKCPKAEARVSMEDFGITEDGVPEQDQEFVELYLTLHRININVRQVYPDDSDH